MEGGAQVVVLEARDRVGGRTRNVDLGGGKVVEVGGQWVGPGHDRLRALAREVVVPVFPTHTRGESILEWNGELRRYTGVVPRMNPIVLADFGQSALRLERLAKSVDLGAPWETPDSERLDSETFATWLRRNVASPSGVRLWRGIIQAVWAVEPKDLSLLHVLFYLASSGGLEYLLNVEGGAQQDRFVGGSQQVAIRVAEQLGGRVHLSTPVTRIAHRGDGVRVAGSDGEAVLADHVVVAVPPALRHRIIYDPPLSADQDQVCQRMPLGSVVKCFAVYDQPWWRLEGLSGLATSGEGPITVTFDNSPPDGSPGVILAFLEGGFARVYGRMSTEERRGHVVAHLTRLFGARAAQPERYFDQVWADEQWSRGCYGANFPPGGWTEYGHALRGSVGPIRWAGAETATRFCGYMEGAVRSGEDAAAAILSG